MTSPDPQLQPWVPAGFDEFWAAAVREATEFPLEWSLGEAVPGRSTTHEVFTATLKSSCGITLHGWVAKPLTVPEGELRDAVSQGAAFLWTPPYSRWSMMPNEYGTRLGYVSASFNLFGEESFHEEVYTPARGYFADGIESRDTWVFRRLFIDSVLALRVLGELPFVNAEKVAAMGMSQGAGISVWLGAFAPGIKCVVADMPFLGGGRQLLSAPYYRYPLKEIIDWIGESAERREQVMQTVSFFDTVNVATRCHVPTLVTAGTKDPSVRPPQAKAVFEALAGTKEYELMDWGHDWHPSMVARNLDWLDKWTA